MQANYKKSALVLGVLSALAFAPIFILPAFMISFALAFKIADNLPSYKKVCAFGYWFGFAHFVIGLYWIGNALLVDFVSFGWLYPITIMSIGAFFGLFAIPSFIIWHFMRSGNLYVKVLSFACVWVLAEWLRSFFLTGFPWNMLGTVFAFHDAYIQTASIWGTYGLSFIAVLLVGCVYAMFSNKISIGFTALLGIIIALSTFGFWRISTYDAVSSDIKIRMVQPSIPQSMKWKSSELESNFFEYVNLSKKEGLEQVDFVIWGETALPFDIRYRSEYKEFIKDAIPDNGYLVTGVVRFELFDNYYSPYNSMYVIDKNADIVNFYDKNHLVPFGEYIPFRKHLPNWVRPITNNIADFATSEKFKNIKLNNYPDFGGLICYEIIFPDNVVNRNAKPKWLVVLTNDGWYGKSSGPYQHLVAAQMRAVEEGITIVRSANSGISAIVSPMGQILNKIDLHEKGYLDVFLPKNIEINTLYSHIGSTGIVLSVVLILCFLILLDYRHFRKSTK